MKTENLSFSEQLDVEDLRPSGETVHLPGPGGHRPMYGQRLCAAVLIALIFIASPGSAPALTGMEGTFEYGFDAPWRLEPSRDVDGQLAYGLVPIQITIHDAYMANYDPDLWETEDLLGDGWATVIDALMLALYPPGLIDGILDLFGADVLDLPGPAELGDFCEVTVTANPRSGTGLRRSFSFDDLAEVEATSGPWVWDDRGSTAIPEHRVCRPSDGQVCTDLRTLRDSSEWHALAWMPLPADAVPGDRVPMEIEVLMTREQGTPCDLAAEDVDYGIVLRNHVMVELGREALPRFNSNWLYGDLHYHSQGTDNEGESGYNYRGVVRAMGAMGLDFAFATEHASSSEQIIDADLKFGFDYNDYVTGVLRDMNDDRFRFLHDQLHGSGGVNERAAHDAGGGREPQTVRANGTVPQLFLGGEVDIIPEVRAADIDFSDLDHPTIPYGNGLLFDAAKLCTNKMPVVGDDECSVGDVFVAGWGDDYLFTDTQGLDEQEFARQHLIYLPRRAGDVDAFVASHTGRFGGGGRRLADAWDGHPPVASEIADHGYAFLAHPLSGGGDHNLGPGSVPYFDSLLEKAFASPAILGLQLWNENSRLRKSVDWDTDFGYQRPEGTLGALAGERLPVTKTRLGFYTGHFELHAERFHYSAVPAGSGRDKGLAHGAYTWDRMNLWGLDPQRTAELSWLEAGEPRKVLMAGGSDAHGDLNYRREGYFVETDAITDTALGTPRNLVYAGVARNITSVDPGTSTTMYGDVSEDTGSSGTRTSSLGGFSTGTMTTTSASAPVTATTTTAVTSGELAPESGPEPKRARHTQRQIVDALASGHFAITDGPALRIVVDNNRSGTIDAGDTPMGGVVDLYGDDDLPLLVEWQSTPEFGGVTRVDLYVGAHAAAGARLYGSEAHGPRSPGVPSTGQVEDFYALGQHYRRGADNYWRIDGLPLSIHSGTSRTVCHEEPKPMPPCKDPETCEITDPGTVTVCESVNDGTLSGLEPFDLDLRSFRAANDFSAERLFVRAYAVTGYGHERYAYTNPIWAVQRDFDTCPTTAANAIDGDLDGLPDGCDACPDLPEGGPIACYGNTTTGTLYTAPEPEPEPAGQKGTGRKGGGGIIF